MVFGLCSCSIIQQLDFAGSPHPGLRPNAAHPVSEACDEAKIFSHLLFADQPHGGLAAIGTEDGGPQEPFQRENAFGARALGVVFLGN